MTHTRKTSHWLLMSWKNKNCFVNLVFVETTFPQEFRCRRAADNEFLVCVTCHGLLRMWTTTEQTNTYSSSVSFSGSKALYYQTFENLFRARRRLHWGKRSLKTSICAIMIILRLIYLTRIQQCWTGKSKVNKEWGGFHDLVAYCMREVNTGKP